MTDCLIFRIRFHKHGSGSRPWILFILYVLLVWWRGNHGSAVGWSFCFYVPILFRFTSKKFVYLIRHSIRHKRKKKKIVWALCIQIGFFKYFEISATTCLLRRLSTNSLGFISANPCPCPPPIAFAGRGGGVVVLSFHNQVHIWFVMSHDYEHRVYCLMGFLFP